MMTTTTPTYLIAHQPDGSFRLADAEDAAAQRWRCHVLTNATTWRELVAAGLQLEWIAENYWYDLGALDPELADVIGKAAHAPPPMPPADHDIRREVDGLLTDQQPSLTADAPFDLPPEVLELAARVGESFMSPGSLVWDGSVAGRAIDLLTEQGIDLVEDSLSLLSCLDGTCTCDHLADDLAAIRLVASGMVARDEILHGLWISDGYARPDPSIDLVVTVAYGVDGQTPVASGTREIVSAFEDTTFQPIDGNAFEVAVEAVVAGVRSRERVLVRCQAGVNRSALVVAESMARLGYPRERVVELVRERRPGTLRNSFFVDIARGVIGPDMIARS